MVVRNINKILFILVLGLVSLFYGIYNVNAEDNLNNQINSNYLIYIDGSEVIKYDLVDGKEVKIKQVYDGSNDNYTFCGDEEFIIDYSNNLYGEYKYKFSLCDFDKIIDSKDITINYLGDNNTIINTNNIYYKDKNYYILGDMFTVLDVILMFNQNLDQYNAKLSVVDENYIELDDNEIVKSGYKLKVSGNYVEYENIIYIEDYFDINVVGDINNDGFIDNIDLKSMMVDDIFNNSDSIFDRNDIRDIGINDSVDASDLLIKTIEYQEQIYIGDELEVKYYIDGFDNDSLSAVMGKISYDKEMLEFISVEINNIYGKYDDEGNFIYLLDNYKKNGLFITIKFKGLKSGNSVISLDDISFITSGGDIIISQDMLFSEEIIILDYGKGGDVEEDNLFEEESLIEVVPLNKVENTNIVQNIIYEELFPSKEVQYISLSSNNYIKVLEIKGYEIDFDKDILDYSIKVGSNVDKLDIDVMLYDNDSFYEIVGNDNFKSGINEVFIIVTSLDGSVRTYNIEVNKEDNSIVEKGSDEEKNTSRNIIIMLIILVIIGLINIILEDDKKDNI